MARLILSILLAGHGLIHILGFVVPWHLAKIEAMAYKTTVLSGNWDVGDAGIRVIGVIWLLTAIGFIIAAVGLFTSSPWWQTFTLWVVLISLVLCILGWPDSKAGVMVNLIILAYLFIGGRLGWLLFK